MEKSEKTTMSDATFSPKLPHMPTSESFVDVLRHVFNPKIQNTIVRTTLPAGYHDVTDRLLHAPFQLLVDYVQRECALEELLEYPAEHAETYKWYWMFYVRSEALGILYLNRVVQRAKGPLDGPPTQQAHVVKEAELAQNIVYLYDWWVNVRPMQIKVINITDDPAKKHMLELALHKQDQEHLFALINLRMQPWF